MFQKIFTITLNPALDTTLFVDRYDLNEPVTALKEKVFPGGKAVNVSRVLTSLGVANKAFIVSGEENAAYMRSLLRQENICFEMILSQGKIRENLSIVLPEQGILQINRKGMRVPSHIIEQLKFKVEQELIADEETLMVFAGSLPKEVSKAQYIAFMQAFMRDNIKLCVDTDLLSEQEICKLKPFLIKPNQIELGHIAGRTFSSIDEMKEYAFWLSGWVTHVLVSLGKDGLLYAGGGKCLHLSSLHVTVKSTVGAGDTTLAGFISGLVTGLEIEECVHYALACGSASVTLEGTGVVTKQQVDEMLTAIMRK